MATPPAPPPDLRPLRVGEILDVGIKVYMRNAKTLFKLVALVVIPVQIVGVLIILSTLPDAFTTGSQNPFQFTGDPSTGAMPNLDYGDVSIFVAGTLVVLLLGFIGTTVATGACFKAVSDAYLGAEPDWKTSLRYTLDHFWPLLWLTLLSAFGSGIGFLFCILPGIWLAIVWSVSTPALLTEGVRGTRALSRSFRLVQSRFWPVTGVLVVSYLIRLVLNSAIGGGITLLTFTDIGQNVVLTQVLSGFANTVASILATPFQAAVVAVLYFDLRVRTEGFDLQLLAQRLGTTSPQGAHAALLPPPVPTVPVAPVAPAYQSGVPAPPMYTAPPANGLAIASLVAGIVMCIGSIPAVIMGHMALNRINRSGGTQGGRGLAIAGVILGWAGTAFLLLIVIGTIASN